MDKKIAKEWCKELRSKKYKQGQKRLCVDDKYCCLGVLCELAKKNGVIVKIPNMGALPAEVQKWAGMRSNFGHFEGTNLADLNDGGASNMKLSLKNGKKVEVRTGRKAKFSTIANIIESKVDEL